MSPRLGLHLDVICRGTLDHARDVLRGSRTNHSGRCDMNVEIVRLDPLYVVQRIVRIGGEVGSATANSVDTLLECAWVVAHDDGLDYFAWLLWLLARSQLLSKLLGPHEQGEELQNRIANDAINERNGEGSAS